MGSLRLESRRDGSLLLTATRGLGRGVAAAGLGIGTLLLATLAIGETTVLAGALVLPLGLIALLAGIGAVRHRDWMLFDRGAREIAFRRGLVSMFRSVSTVPFDEVEAIVLADPDPADGTVTVLLLRSGDYLWPVDVDADPAHARRLATALEAVGGWPVQQGTGRPTPSVPH